MKERLQRLVRALSHIGQIDPTIPEHRLLDRVCEYFIEVGELRSVRLFIKLHNELVAMRNYGHRGLVRGRVGPLSILIPQEEETYYPISEDTPIGYVIRTGKTLLIVDGKSECVGESAFSLTPAWAHRDIFRGRVCWFTPLRGPGGEPVAVIAGGCVLEDAEQALDWLDWTQPLLDVAGVKLWAFVRMAQMTHLKVNPDLSEREKQTLKLIGDGLSVSQIASELEVSPSTVKTYRQRIREKTGLLSDAALIRYAIRTGLSRL